MSDSKPERGIGAPPSPVLLSAVILLGVVCAAFLQKVAGPVFRPYFGPIDPVVAVVVALGTGAAALSALWRYGWFAVHRRGPSGLPPATAAAVALAVPVVVVDLLGGFGPDINVGWPSSVLFYPLMALVAESVFHVIPLGALSVLMQGTGRDPAVASPPAVAMGAVCLLEPALQVVWGSEVSPLWANVYVGVHVLIINVLGIYFFRRYDVVSMLWFRLVYYLLWHVTWGALRLEIVFFGP